VIEGVLLTFFDLTNWSELKPIAGRRRTPACRTLTSLSRVYASIWRPATPVIRVEVTLACTLLLYVALLHSAPVRLAARLGNPSNASST
jgi:hypothetical protein